MRLPSFLRQIIGPRAADPAMDDRYFQPVGRLATAGVTVTPDTAMKVSAVYRCVALLSNAFAALPYGTFRRLEKGRKEIPDHEATQIFMVRPNPYQAPFVFKRLMMGHLVLRGNAYARIVDGSDGKELWPLHPDRISGPELLPSGRLRYKYLRPDTNQNEILMGGLDILHVSGLSTDGLRGLALSDNAMDSIGLALATEQYGSKLFSQGVRLAGVLKAEGKLDDKARDYISRSFRENFGGQKGAHGVPVLEQGMEFQQIGMSADDAQFLETRKFEVSDIARWFGIPPHMVGDVERSTSWGSGIEAQSVQFVQYGLMPWLVLWEQEIERAFISEEDVYGRFNVSGLLRADAQARSQVQRTYVEIGVLSPNDVRELEELNPRDGGDVYVTPRSPNEPAPAGGKGPEGPPEPDPEPEDEPEEPPAAATTPAAPEPVPAPMPPPEPPPQPVAAPPPPAPEPPTPSPIAARALLAVEFLAWQTGVMLLGEEGRALARLAKEHARDDGAWRQAVASYYGRRAARVQESIRCEPEEARAFCEGQRETLLMQGLKAWEESKETAVATLLALAMRAAMGGKDAAA